MTLNEDDLNSADIMPKKMLLLCSIDFSPSSDIFIRTIRDRPGHTTGNK